MQKDEHATFGSWMLVKRNTRNRNESKQIKGNKGKKANQMEVLNRDAGYQSHFSPNGSKFAILENNEGGTRLLYCRMIRLI